MEKDKIIVDQLLKQWTGTCNSATQLFDKLATSWDKEISPGRNKVSYIVGHLTAYNDRMIEALDLGERQYPELDENYIEQPQKEGMNYADYKEAKEKWLAINEYLSNKFKAMSVEDWLSKHHYVSTEDFAKEPHRDKLAILVSRLGHVYMHLGQLRLIKD
jgi:hypothetical protein